MIAVLSLLATFAVPSVQVDARGLSGDPEERRLVGHVIERLLEAGVAVDPAAPLRLSLGHTDRGYSVELREGMNAPLGAVEVHAGEKQSSVVQLEVVQVAVDLARLHASDGDPPQAALHITTSPEAADRRAELLATANDSGVALVPTPQPGARILCMTTRDDGIALAESPSIAACPDALVAADAHASIADAWSSARDEPIADQDPPPPRSAPAPEASERVAPRSPAASRWSTSIGLALRIAWRPNAVDAAVAIGTQIASPRGLALAVDATFLPSRTPLLTTLDTMLTAGAGYRGVLATRGRWSVVPGIGAMVHGAWFRDAQRRVRVDPVVALPIEITAAVHRRVELGGRFAIATTWRGRTHSVRGIEVWHRGAVAMFVAAIARFG